MKTLKILGIVCALFVTCNSQAQVFEKLGKRVGKAAERTVERRVERETRKSTDRALDSVIEAPKKEKRRKKRKDRDTNDPIIKEVEQDSTQQKSKNRTQ